MVAQPKLSIVRDAPQSIDITAGLRADIMARDWAKCHINGDKAPAVELPASRKWAWR